MQQLFGKTSNGPKRSKVKICNPHSMYHLNNKWLPAGFEPTRQKTHWILKPEP